MKGDSAKPSALTGHTRLAAGDVFGRGSQSLVAGTTRGGLQFLENPDSGDGNNGAAALELKRLSESGQRRERSDAPIQPECDRRNTEPVGPAGHGPGAGQTLSFIPPGNRSPPAGHLPDQGDQRTRRKVRATDSGATLTEGLPGFGILDLTDFCHFFGRKKTSILPTVRFDVTWT
jgi:hypothetical protein